ncbi:helix-turn-helix domain-containing protein [Streptomyces sp. NPDC059650]|uniref:helix-turn-helix domain-containing protein n=1 Tax=Streptomyces sp. NPDC059650 TaxID=3346896 RepID=UPI0036B7065C
MDPVDLLPSAEAARWASDLLRPLDSLPARTRGQLLSTVSLALRFTAVRTAKIMGVSRKTVRSRMVRAGELLGMDLDDVRVRTALRLALQLRDRPTVPGRHDPGLPALIGTDAGRAEARNVLGALDTDARNLHHTLGARTLADCSVGVTAQRLCLHPQTVPEHLRSAGALLARELTAGGVDVYEHEEEPVCPPRPHGHDHGRRRRRDRCLIRQRGERNLRELGGTVCTSGSIPANDKHEVCFGGTHKALSYWGRAELWDADTGERVGTIATKPYRYQQTCVGGLDGQHYYERGTGGDFKGDVWND